MTTQPVVEARGIVKRFGSTNALQDVDLPPGGWCGPIPVACGAAWT
jgi:hypothetical protein